MTWYDLIFSGSSLNNQANRKPYTLSWHSGHEWDCGPLQIPITIFIEIEECLPDVSCPWLFKSINLQSQCSAIKIDDVWLTKCSLTDFWWIPSVAGYMGLQCPLIHVFFLLLTCHPSYVMNKTWSKWTFSLAVPWINWWSNVRNRLLLFIIYQLFFLFSFFANFFFSANFFCCSRTNSWSIQDLLFE